MIKLNNNELKILHLPKYAARKGGMDTLLRLHANNGESVYGILRYKNLQTIGFATAFSFCLQRIALKRLSELSSRHDVSIYYNCWGADLFSSYDQAQLRVGYLHNHFPNFKNYIRHFAKFLDGFLTVNPATTQMVREITRRTHPPENIQTIPLPIHPPDTLPAIKKEAIIGLVGRINYEQKRYERLPEFASLLAKTRPDLRIEVMGEGPNKSELIQRTRHMDNVSYRPWTVGDVYWKTLSSWKYILFLSDYEGLPISLLEAIHAGCIPIYPDFHNGQQQELPLLLYPKGDMYAAVQCLEKRFELPTKPDTYTTEEAYIKNFTHLLTKISHTEKTSFSLPLVRRSVSYNRLYRKLIS